jgi:hypothetical protein
VASSKLAAAPMGRPPTHVPRIAVHTTSPAAVIGTTYISIPAPNTRLIEPITIG